MIVALVIMNFIGALGVYYGIKKGLEYHKSKQKNTGNSHVKGEKYEWWEE